MNLEQRICGCLLGIAVGDAIGLPLENLSRRRVDAWLGNGPLRHRLLFGHGLVSDDTEHSCLVGQSLHLFAADPEQFGKDLAWRLKWWLAGLPAGTGRATAKACLKLWFGVSHHRSGIWSAGNGPPMRAPIIGVAIENRDQAIELTKISSRITHSDPKATYGALAIAAVAHQVTHYPSASVLSPDNVSSVCADWISNDDDIGTELVDLIIAAAESVTRGESTRQFAEQMGLERGVSGYTYHTVPVALHACMHDHDDFSTAIENLIRCGGDVDSTAAIAGGILGAHLGESSLPADWLDRLIEWPRSKEWMRHLASSLATGSESASVRMPTINPAAQFLRNLVFLLVILVHAARRLLPPY